MIFYIYAVFLLISVGVLLYMGSKNYENIDIYYWSMVVVIPIVLLGYTMKARASSVDDAWMAFCFIYLDSTLLLTLGIFCLLKSLGIRVPMWFKMGLYGLTALHLFTIWSCKDNDLYYATMTVTKTSWGSVTKMTDGPLKFTHYLYLALLFVIIIAIMVYAFRYKKECSKKSLMTYAWVLLLGLLFYVVELTAGLDFSVLPLLYVIADIVIAIEYDKFHSHDINCLIVDQNSDDARYGYVAFDMKKNLLGYTEKAVEFVPELKGRQIDEPISDQEEKLKNIFVSLMDQYAKEHKASTVFQEDMVYFNCKVKYFTMHQGGKPAGYVFELEDVTAEQGYINLIREYSQSMKKEVEAQTTHIRSIQEQITLGMATIIENRDQNTGGHVRRTSDIIHIIVDEMRKQGTAELDDEFLDEIVRSAPMHDLGKISIDNAILCKPGKLTDEEYAIMKTHSVKSGEIVKAILDGVESPHFVQTAYQLARFHHERWDGKGYPERLAEIEIPLEARIMAVADVYDALVSKRCYKEPMSFEKAAEIMIEGMGTQFDPMMKPVFEGCREQLEAYYKVLREE